MTARYKSDTPAGVATALSGRMEFHVYRALCGLLEHLRAVNLRGRNIMHGLYRPHGPGGASQEGPSGVVRCDQLMRSQFHSNADGKHLGIIGEEVAPIRAQLRADVACRNVAQGCGCGNGRFSLRKGCRPPVDI
jgi:hypothetical protein